MGRAFLFRNVHFNPEVLLPLTGLCEDEMTQVCCDVTYWASIHHLIKYLIYLFVYLFWFTPLWNSLSLILPYNLRCFISYSILICFVSTAILEHLSIVNAQVRYYLFISVQLECTEVTLNKHALTLTLWTISVELCTPSSHLSVVSLLASVSAWLLGQDPTHGRSVWLRQPFQMCTII